MIDTKDITKSSMEKERSWNVSEEAKKRWYESEERMKRNREKKVDEWKKLGETIDAEYIGVTPPPPWHPGPIVYPAVYRSNMDGTFFRIAGRKDEVASTSDPEEVQQRAKIRYSIPLGSIGEYAIVPIDLQQHIDKGNPFYLGEEGYINYRLYDPKQDPQLFPYHAKTSADAK